jgi:hypothetical protein
VTGFDYETIERLRREPRQDFNGRHATDPPRTPAGTVLQVAPTRRDDPPGLSSITTVGRYDTVEAAQVATDEVWASR